MHRFALPLAAALTLFAGTAEATQQGNTAIANWKRMDVCAKQAQAAFPDYTAEFERQTRRQAERVLEQRQPAADRALAAAAIPLTGSAGAPPQPA